MGCTGSVAKHQRQYVAQLGWGEALLSDLDKAKADFQMEYGYALDIPWTGWDLREEET